MRGCRGPRTAKRDNVAGNLPHVSYRTYLANGGRLSYTLSVERVVG